MWGLNRLLPCLSLLSFSPLSCKPPILHFLIWSNSQLKLHFIQLYTCHASKPQPRFSPPPHIARWVLFLFEKYSREGGGLYVLDSWGVFKRMSGGGTSLGVKLCSKFYKCPQDLSFIFMIKDGWMLRHGSRVWRG